MEYKDKIKELEEDIITKQNEISNIKNWLLNTTKLIGSFENKGEEFTILSHNFFLNHDLDISHSFLVDLKNTRSKNLSKKGEEPKVVQIEKLSIHIVNERTSTTYWANKEIPGYGTTNLGIESSNEPIAEEIKNLIKGGI